MPPHDVARRRGRSARRLCGRLPSPRGADAYVRISAGLSVPVFYPGNVSRVARLDRCDLPRDRAVAVFPRPRGGYVYLLLTCPARFRGVVGRVRFVPAPAVLLRATDERTDIFLYLSRFGGWR